MELLAGADTPERQEARDTLANGLPLLSVDVRIDFRQAAGIYQAVRRRGHTVRSLVACLIASVAMRHDVPILHEDRDYVGIVACLPPANTDLGSRQRCPTRQPRGRDHLPHEVPT